MHVDQLHDDILNCCWKWRLPHWAVSFGNGIGTILNPIKFTMAIEFSFFVFYFINIHRDHQTFQIISNIHHLLLYAMTTSVGNYIIFKQKRPCKDIGSVYGMPSSDATFGGCIGGILMDYSFLLGILVIVLISYSRVARGYHTILQVIVGSMVGYFIQLFRFSSERNNVIIIGWVAAAVYPLIVFIDPHVRRPDNLELDLRVWYIIDLLYLAFDIIECSPDKFMISSSISEGWRLILAGFTWITIQLVYRLIVEGIIHI